MTGPLTPRREGSIEGSISTGPDAGTTVVLRGEVDTECAGLLGSLADDAVAAGRPVVLDVAGVTFMDSTGAAFVATLVRGLGSGRVTVLRPSDQVRFLLAVTRLGTVVHVVTDPGDPLDAAHP